MGNAKGTVGNKKRDGAGDRPSGDHSMEGKEIRRIVFVAGGLGLGRYRL